MRSSLMVILVVASASFSAPAAAQELPALDRETLARADALDRARIQLRRGTWMITAGTVMAIAGSTFLQLGLSDCCHEAGRPPHVARAVGALNLASGLGLAVGGVFPVLQQRHGPRGSHRGARIFGNMALGALLGALMSGPAIGVATPDLMLCE
jgi:hypothetical protein